MAVLTVRKPIFMHLPLKIIILHFSLVILPLFRLSLKKKLFKTNIYDSGSISFRHANVKTAIAVMLCILLFQFSHRGSPMIACLAAVFR